MFCKDCGVEMVAGIAIVPVWGTLDNRPVTRGTTLNMVNGCASQVCKCPDCGRSVFFGKEFVQSIGGCDDSEA